MPGRRGASSANDRPHPIDILVGMNIRLRRRELTLSQENLANAVNLTFQQIQKYERGANRVSASKLFEIAEALGMPVALFFEGPDRIDHPAPGPLSPTHEFLMTEEGAELIRLFPRIERPAMRARILQLVRQLAGGPPVRREPPSEP